MSEREIEFYQYLPAKHLEKKIARDKEILEDVKKQQERIRAAINICNVYTEEDFKKILSILPLIIWASGGKNEFVNERDKNLRYIDRINQIECRNNLEKLNQELSRRASTIEREIELLQNLGKSDNRPPSIPEEFMDGSSSSGYLEGGIVIRFDERDSKGRLTYGPLRAVSITNPMADLGEMLVRPLTDAEYSKYNLENLRPKPGVYRSRYLRYSFAMTLETYIFYLEHPECINMHINAFECSGRKPPGTLLVLKEHLSQ